MAQCPRSTEETELLIIGAGPFGLSLAAYAAQQGIDYTLVGKPMEFWHTHMPHGMYLRSACDWHLDPANVATIERFLALQGRTPADVEPLWQDDPGQVDPHHRGCQASQGGAVCPHRPGREASVRKHRAGSEDDSPPAGSQSAKRRLHPG